MRGFAAHVKWKSLARSRERADSNLSFGICHLSCATWSGVSRRLEPCEIGDAASSCGTLGGTDKYRFNTTFNCTAPLNGGTALNAENN
jgi:hypothetical protein